MVGAERKGEEEVEGLREKVREHETEGDQSQNQGHEGGG